MRRPTWLDQIVYGFQHRWETAPQFRAMASGLVGLVMILIMCSCMGVLNATASSALAAIGLGGSGNGPTAQGTPNTGTNQLNGYQAIPTPTVVYPTGVVIPQATLPQSQTPPPNITPTAVPSPTDTPNPGGGGGGTCNGGGGGTSWNFSPCPAHIGASVVLTISAPKYAGDSISVEIKWGGTGGNDCFQLLQTGQSLNGSGNWSDPFNIPSDCSGPVTGNYIINGGAYTGIISGPNVQ